MADLVLSVNDAQARRLAGVSWQVGGRPWVFKDFDPSTPEAPPWDSGAEGRAYPLLGPDGRVEAYFKSFHSGADKRLYRTEWLIGRQVCLWAPQTRSAPTRWIDTREQGRPVGLDFDFTGHLAASAAGTPWQRLKPRLASDWPEFSLHLRWRVAEELIRALAVLENAGLVHGDLEPGNIVVDLDAEADHPLIQLIDFDAFAIPATPSLGLQVKEGGVLGTPGYCPPQLVAAADQGDPSAVPFSDRYARDMLLVEFLLVGPGIPLETAPAQWDRRVLDNHFQSLMGQSPSRLWPTIRQLDPAVVFSRKEDERPSANDLARMLGIDVPPLRATSAASVLAVSAEATGSTETPAACSTPAIGSLAKGPWTRLTAAMVLMLAIAAGVWHYVVREQPAHPSPVPNQEKPRAGESTAQAAAGEVFPLGLAPGRLFTNGLGMVFTAVPRTALLFSIWETRVEDYGRFARATQRPLRKPDFPQGPNHPAVNITKRDALDFCEWLTATEGAEGRLAPAHSYRLPSANEWRFAASLELNKPREAPPAMAAEVLWEAFPWGDEWPPRSGCGNYAPGLGVDSFPYTAPVGSFPPNRYGLFDLGGNVWEWCEGTMSRSGLGVLQGASWRDQNPTVLDSWWGEAVAPDAAHEFNGFRIVLADPLIGGTVAARGFVPMRPSHFTRERSILTNSLGMEFLPILGTTLLGAICETRVQDYEAFVKAKGRPWAKPSFQQGLTHPAVNVSWYNAAEFCAWLTDTEHAQDRLHPRQVYRLPTSAEWSWALGLTSPDGSALEDRMGPNTPVFPWGLWWPPRKGAGNYDPALHTDDFPRTAPVGSFSPGQRGFYDLGGNVWEWCEDTYEPGPMVPVVRGRPAPLSRSARVMRGAAWNVRERKLLSSAYQARGEPDYRNEALGFRVVLEDHPTNLGQ